MLCLSPSVEALLLSHQSKTPNLELKWYNDRNLNTDALKLAHRNLSLTHSIFNRVHWNEIRAHFRTVPALIQVVKACFRTVSALKNKVYQGACQVSYAHLLQQMFPRKSCLKHSTAFMWKIKLARKKSYIYNFNHIIHYYPSLPVPPHN